MDQRPVPFDRAGALAKGAGRRLSRTAAGTGPAAPVRIAHLGIGKFARAHQVWYTHRAPDAAGWGIAAFTGRRGDLVDALAPQDGLYTLITRDDHADAFEVIGSLSAVHPATDTGAWRRYLTDPLVSVVTCTVTEAGYHRALDGSLDLRDPAVRADIAALRSDRHAPVQTAPARLAAGLWARHAAGAGPIAVVPCDNLPDNGSAVARVVRDLAGEVSAEMVDAATATGSFVTSMVDRITPAALDADRAAVTASTGWVDAAPVVTEPFSEWIISGEFPAGRPDWQAAGASVVGDVAPFEQRKLWLLNGSHSLLAYCGSILGHRTVDRAVADPTCRGWMRQWWDEASAHLSLPAEEIGRYREALLRRYANPRIGHRLADIAADGSQKLPVRILPVLRAELAAGRLPTGACRVLAGWICRLRVASDEVRDTAADEFLARAAGPLPDAVPRVLAGLDPTLARSADVAVEISRLAAAFESGTAR